MMVVQDASIAFQDSNKGWIIDPTIRMESHADQPVEVHNEKCSIYNATISYYKNKYQLKDIVVLGLMVEARGTITSQFVQFCRQFNLDKIFIKEIAIRFSEAKVDKIKEACAKLETGAFLTALEVSERRKQVFRLSTGSKELDKLLGGGIESMAITEAFGEFRTGKTQLSHTLCVSAQMPGEGGYMGGKVIFVDTEHTFRPERLRSISDRFNLHQSAVLDNVLYARAYTSEHQYELLDYVAAKFHEEAGVFKLLIIDSVMALFRVDFSGRGELADRQQKLAQVMSRLQKISEEYNVAVFITNQMTADPGATLTFQADPKKPIGGNILAHASTTRIYLRKGRGETRIAKIYDSAKP
ncbi:Meiotic recombination protein DMC1/LIM15 [Blattella germanica]|nr:Meiotic recombination protein DMC1/LIM15 [Blattella germanica]